MNVKQEGEFTGMVLISSIIRPLNRDAWPMGHQNQSYTLQFGTATETCTYNKNGEGNGKTTHPTHYKDALDSREGSISW